MFVIADTLFAAYAGPLALFVMEPNISANQRINSRLNVVYPDLELPPVIQFNSFHIKLCLGSGGGCIGHLTEQRVLVPGPGPGVGGSDGMGQDPQLPFSKLQR